MEQMHTTYVDRRTTVYHGRIVLRYYAACTCGWQSMYGYRTVPVAHRIAANHQQDEAPAETGAP